MTIDHLATTIRAKKLGVLVRKARVESKKSQEECAQAIGVSLARFQEYELGEEAPSLPEIEILAYSLNVPLEHFWGSEAFIKEKGPDKKIDPKQLVKLRQKMIGVQIRQARADAGLSLERLSEKAGLPIENLKAYEFGEAPASIPQLEILASALNRPLKYFLDRNGPVGAWSAQQQAIQGLLDMPPELQSFVSKPVNRPYLELAQRLSEMSVEKLRAVAEGLLEITL